MEFKLENGIINKIILGYLSSPKKVGRPAEVIDGDSTYVFRADGLLLTH